MSKATYTTPDMDYAPDTDYAREATDEELLRIGYQKHTQTTDAVKSAEKTAMMTEQLAKETLEKMHEQGDQMQRLTGSMDEMEKSVDKSSSILKWFGRWFWCCNCCRAEDPAPRGGWEKKHYKSKLQPKDMAPQPPPRRPEAIRAQRLAASGQVRDSAAPRQKYVIGNDIDGPMGDLIAQESREQDRALDNISNALTNLHEMSKQMQSEVQRQDRILDDSAGHMDHVHMRVNKLSQDKQLRRLAA